MPLIQSLSHSHALLEEIIELNHDAEIRTLLTSLATELASIDSLAKQLTIDNATTQAPATAEPQIESGCYIFANEKGFFCPTCYDNSGHKIATARINKKLRVCPQCRASIK